MAFKRVPNSMTSFRQPASQPASQPANQPASQPTSQPANQPTSQPTNQTNSLTQPADQPTGQANATNKHNKQTQQTNTTNKQAIKQAANQTEHKPKSGQSNNIQTNTVPAPCVPCFSARHHVLEAVDGVASLECVHIVPALPRDISETMELMHGAAKWADQNGCIPNPNPQIRSETPQEGKHYHMAQGVRTIGYMNLNSPAK